MSGIATEVPLKDPSRSTHIRASRSKASLESIRACRARSTTNEMENTECGLCEAFLRSPNVSTF